jgi:fucose permease
LPAPRILICLAFIAFISLGLPDCVLGVAWPSIRHDFARPLTHLAHLLAAGTAGYLCSSFLGGHLLQTLGAGRLLAASCALVSLSLAAFALAQQWPLLVIAAIVAGLGAGAIDAGINTVAAQRFSPRIVNFLHASWGIGATTGPLLMTALLATGHTWRLGYATLALALLALALLFFATRRLWQQQPTPSTPSPHLPTSPSLLHALRTPIIPLQTLVFFIYCGIESTAGQLLYTLFTESRGVAVTAAGVTVSAYWFALTLGRIVFGQLTAHGLTRTAVLRTAMVLAPIAAALIALDGGTPLTFAATALLGSALGPIFPTLISATPDRVGPQLAHHAVGFQVAAASLGIATFPGLVAILARRHGLEIVCAYLVLAPISLFLLHELTLRTARRSAAPGDLGPTTTPVPE